MFMFIIRLGFCLCLCLLFALVFAYACCLLSYAAAYFLFPIKYILLFQHGNAPIHEAAWNGFSRTLELLVKHNVNVATINKVK